MLTSLSRGRVVRAAAALTALTTVSGTALGVMVAPAVSATVPSDRTSVLEARRVDRVKLAPVRWFTCTSLGGQCATIRLPLDYDQPNGPTTQVAIGRVRAAKPKQRIGTLFVNPGGPGGSAVDIALSASLFLSQSILDRFDVVGVDPRGVGHGDTVRCFPTLQAQVEKTPGLSVAFPVTAAETKAYIRSARAFAEGCGTTGQPLAGSMSTAQVARDMDVVRRTLGDTQLTYLGFSYGTQLGQVYANMFPDRVRAVVVDGVIDPVAWTTGQDRTGRTVPVDDRLRSADGSWKALRELLTRCDRAGAPTCSFAGSGDSVAKFNTLARRLEATPFQRSTITGDTVPFGYADLISATLGVLYSQFVGNDLAAGLQDIWAATDPAAPQTARAAAGLRASADIRRWQAAHRPATVHVTWRGRPGREFPYDNTNDAYASVLCSDSVNPRNPRTWVSAARAADLRAPYFGSLWTWASVECASSLWTARDEDRYLGPFTRRTAHPLLIIGDYFDPATSYEFGAVPASRLAPNSRLLTSNSWGHTAYGTSACVSNAVAAYLIAGRLPRAGTVCTGPQPFKIPAGLQAASGTAANDAASGSAKPAPIAVPPHVTVR